MKKLITVLVSIAILTSIGTPQITVYCSNCVQSVKKCAIPSNVIWEHCGAEEWGGTPFEGCREFRKATWTCPSGTISKATQEFDVLSDSCNSGTCNSYL